MNGNERFTMSEIAAYSCINKVGRTILYRILRELEIVDGTNKPDPEYIRHGYVCIGQPRYVSNRQLKYVTLAIGISGMNFIDRVVRFYLRDHPIPRVKRKPKNCNFIY